MRRLRRVRPSVSYNAGIIGHGAHRGPAGAEHAGQGGHRAARPLRGRRRRPPCRIESAPSMARPPGRGPPSGPPSRQARYIVRGCAWRRFVSAPAGPPSCARASPPWSARRFFAAASCRRTATQKPGAGPGSCRGCAWCGRRYRDDLILPQGQSSRHPRAAPPRPAGRPRGQSAGIASIPSRTGGPPGAPRGTETAR